METKLPQGVPAILKNQAKYTDKVNRETLMSNDNGSVNIISLKRGMKLSEHVAPADAMVQVIEGRLNFTVVADHYVLPAGDYLTMAKGTPHSLEAVEDTKFLLTFLK